MHMHRIGTRIGALCAFISLAVSGHAAAIDLGISCGANTPEAEKLVLPVSQKASVFCIQKSSLRSVDIDSAKSWFDPTAKVWWVVYRFSSRFESVLKSLTSAHVGAELAIIKNGKVLTFGFIAAPNSGLEYGTTAESEASAKELAAEIGSKQ